MLINTFVHKHCNRLEYFATGWGLSGKEDQNALELEKKG